MIFCISDHYAVFCDIHSINRLHIPNNSVSYRKTKSIDIESFKNDIATTNISPIGNMSIEELVVNYNRVFSNTLDQHAPVITKNCSRKKHSAP